MLFINNDIRINNDGSEGDYEIFARGFDDCSSVFMFAEITDMATYLSYSDGPGEMISLIYVEKGYDENHNTIFTGECAYSSTKWIKAGSRLRFTVLKDAISISEEA